MTTFLYKSLILCFIILSSPGIALTADPQRKLGKICGYLKLDGNWDPSIYLSYIPTFDEMYTISNEHIIAKTEIDSRGYFEFDIGFIPEEDHLFRLHIIKKGDGPASLAIGGKDENHFFLLANRYSKIVFEATSFNPPFRKVNFTEPTQNISLQTITDIVNIADSVASQSTVAKRRFIEDKLYEDLIYIADTAKNPLISLYAIYKGKFESRYTPNANFYVTYLKKWKNERSTYYKAFRNQVSIEADSNNRVLNVFLVVLIFASGFFIGRVKWKKNNKIEKLSAQERKILELLRQGATNQEISDRYHIEISTVKSHVSNIFSKLNVKSRKEIMNI